MSLPRWVPSGGRPGPPCPRVGAAPSPPAMQETKPPGGVTWLGEGWPGPLGRPLSRSPPGLAPLCPVLGTLHCHLPELLRAAPTLTLLSVTRRACLTAGDSSAPVHPLHACQERGGPGGGCKRLKSSRVPRAPGGREGSAKHVWGPDLQLLRQVRKRRGRLRVPAHHHLPPPPHRCPGPQAAGCPGAELSTVAFSSSGHCGKTVLHI